MNSSAIVQAQVLDPAVRGASIDGSGSGLQPMTNYTCEVMAATVEGTGVAASVTKETGPGERLLHMIAMTLKKLPIFMRVVLPRSMLSLGNVFLQ